MTALAKFKQDVHEAVTTCESSHEMEGAVLDALVRYESCVDPVVTDRERVLTEVFAAYNSIPAGNPSWCESMGQIGRLLDTVDRGQRLLQEITAKAVAEAEKQIR